MSVQVERGEDLIAFIVAEGGEITLTNKAIADKLGFEIGPSRVAELISTLEGAGSITVERRAPHPKTNPSGRVIALVTF